MSTSHVPTDPTDSTLGGYFAEHNRPPAFEGVDRQPYTVSVEVEKRANLRTPWIAYLVFPCWAETGLGIVGHVETPVLWEGQDRGEVEGLHTSHPGQGAPRRGNPLPCWRDRVGER
jgi:hypothetical protein